MSEPLVTVENLKLQRGDFRLEVPDWRVKPGTVVGVVGPNGAGKTTLLRMLPGLDPCPRGSVRVFGLDPVDEGPRVRLSLGFMADDQALFRLRIGKLLRLLSGYWPSWDAKLVEELLERFSLDPRKGVWELSKGEATRIRLICAMAFRPRLLVLDEPATGLDVRGRRQLLESVLDIVGTTLPVLMEGRLITPEMRWPVLPTLPLPERGRLALEVLVATLPPMVLATAALPVASELRIERSPLQVWTVWPIALGLGLLSRRLLDSGDLNRTVMMSCLASAVLAVLGMADMRLAGLGGLLLAGLAMARPLSVPPLRLFGGGPLATPFRSPTQRVLRSVVAALGTGLAFSAGMALLFLGMDTSLRMLEASGGMIAAGMVFGGAMRPLQLSDRSFTRNDRIFLREAVALLPVAPRRLALEAMAIQGLCGLSAVAVAWMLGQGALEPLALLAAVFVSTSLLLASFLGMPRYLLWLALAVVGTLGLLVAHAALKAPVWLVPLPSAALWLACLSRLRGPARPS